MDPEITRELFRNAYLELAKEIPVESITVRQIVKKSSLSRSTFYRHYDDVKSLMSDAYLNEFNRIQKKMGDRFFVGPSVEMLTYLSAHRDFFLGAMRHGGTGSFRELIVDVNRDAAKSEIVRIRGTNLSSDELFTLDTVMRGKVDEVYVWLERGCDVSPAEMSRLMRLPNISTLFPDDASFFG